MLGTILHSHYQIIKVLGIGKSGITYLAKDLDLIDSPLYVVKNIHNVISDTVVPSVVEKLFDIQAEIAHRVGQHPQIPALLARFTDNGDRYLVRAYIDGELLSQELTPDSVWSQTQVFDFLTDLVGILGFVHGFNYIHQDINPHNIIRRSDDGRFSLIGFSCVRDLNSNWQNLPDNDTRNLNDPNYVPYEQEQNAPKLNSDIYAVGVIAIQALTGKFPIEKDAYSYELKWQDKVNIDARLGKIIHKMVRPDYRNRYQSAAEVLQDLQSFAIAQLPDRKSARFQPHLLFGAGICMLLLGFGAVKLFSTSTNKLPSASSVSASIAPTINTSNLQSASSVSTGITPTVGSDRIWKSYTDKAAKIQVKYLSTWHQEDTNNVVTGEHVMFVSPDSGMSSKYRENVSIRIENLTDPQTSLPSYTRSTIAEIDRYYQNAKIIESSSSMLANRPANLVVYTGKDENSILVQNLEIWTIDRGKAYIFTYKAEPNRYYQSLETAMAMINSFELK
jgi:eukaryotic-like serine/threonine-protein kinase